MHGQAADRVAMEVERWRGAPEVARYAALLVDLDRLSAAYVETALLALGCDLTPGHPLDLDAIVAKASSRTVTGGLLARLLEILSEEGLLRRTPEGWVAAREPRGADVGGPRGRRSSRAPATRPS